MKKIKYIPGALALLLFILIASCKVNNPLDGEQYEKQVYIVGANQSNNEGLSKVEIPYTKSESEEAETYISVGTGGSLKINKDIDIRVDEAGDGAINNYNYLHLFNPTDIRYQKLAPSFYRIPENNVKIKSGEVYGRMPIYIKTAALQCDSLYAITFKIGSVSDPGYISIRKADTVLMLSFSFVNQYSGAYTESGSYFKVPSSRPEDTTSLSSPRVLKAVNYNTVRFIHLANSEVAANINPYGVTVRVESDNTLSISPWGSFSLVGGGGTYNPVNNSFNLWYEYMSGGVKYKFSGSFIKNLK